MNNTWWKDGVAYQIYIRSFKDSNGDGIGDLRGIIDKLDYIKSIGVDIIYLNPINKSPNYDNGYDVSDFEDIMDEFGDLRDFDQLLDEIHKRKMRLIMDLVINHSSDEHPWFIDAKKSKDSPYRDYYLWSKGEEGNPPNNWGSFFGGSAWEFHEPTNEYYLHIFSEKQPDFNWENKNLREDIKNIIKFWINKGVDGFRMDAINHLGKDITFPDGEIEEGRIYGNFIPYVQNLPQVHDYLKELRRDVFTPEHVIIGETGGIGYDNAYIYTGIDKEELDFTFHFDMHSVGRGKNDWERVPIDLVKDIKEKMTGWATRDEKEGWCPLFYSNHDTTRTVSRLGNDKEYLNQSAKMLATLQMTQKGTPFIYNGDEIGMTNAMEFTLEDYRDVSVGNNYKELVQSGIITRENFIMGLRYTSRDNSRTPMQWNSEESAGFTTGIPWMRINSNFKEINVENQETDKNSILNYYRKLIALRKENPVFIYGNFTEINRDHKEVYTYERSLDGEKILVVCNFFENKVEYIINEVVDIATANLLLSNYSDVECVENVIFNKAFSLNPYEARIYKLS